MTIFADLLQKTTKFLKIIFWMENFEEGTGIFDHEGSKLRKKV